MNTWKTMTETTKPERGFIYRCPEGHEWFVSLAEWDKNHYDADGVVVPNNCGVCDGLVG